MATRIRVPPGRTGALWLRHRLAVAERGGAVLRQKLTLLATERDRLCRRRDETARSWFEADAAARVALTRAAVLDGAAVALDAAADVTPIGVAPRWNTVMGVRYADAPLVEVPARPAECSPPGGAALVQAQRAYRLAALAAARHAAASAAVSAVEAEIVTTRQRVRALERHWAPRLRSTLADVELQMAEAESADAARRRRAVRS